jgi:hypothetical protein
MHPFLGRVLIRHDRISIPDKPGLFIDCSAKPLVPRGWRLLRHRRHGILEWDETKVSACWHERHELGLMVSNKEFYGSLKKGTALNANPLDFLVDHPSRIPEDWREPMFGRPPLILFPDTTYLNERRHVVVRCLYLDETNDWTDGYVPCDEEWGPGTLIAARLQPENPP